MPGRSHLNHTFVMFVVLGAVVIAGPRVAQAQPDQVIFTVDPTQSVVTVTGKDNKYGAFGPASTLSTPVSGHFVVDFDPSTDTPSSIELTPAAAASIRSLRLIR